MNHTQVQCMLLYAFQDVWQYPLLECIPDSSCTIAAHDEGSVWIHARRVAVRNRSAICTIGLPLRSFEGSALYFELEVDALTNCGITLSATDAAGKARSYAFARPAKRGRQVLRADARAPLAVANQQSETDPSDVAEPVLLHRLRVQIEIGDSDLERIGLMNLRVTGNVQRGRAGLA